MECIFILCCTLILDFNLALFPLFILHTNMSGCVCVCPLLPLCRSTRLSIFSVQTSLPIPVSIWTQCWSQSATRVLSPIFSQWTSLTAPWNHLLPFTLLRIHFMTLFHLTVLPPTCCLCPCPSSLQADQQSERRWRHRVRQLAASPPLHLQTLPFLQHNTSISSLDCDVGRSSISRRFKVEYTLA